jgi:hypothetical protein
MNNNFKFALAALCAVAAMTAQAEAYEGVHPLTTGKDRSAVRAQALAAARQGNPWADSASSGVHAITGQRERAAVRSEATAAAHAPNQNLQAEAFVNSRIPAPFARAGSPVREAGL